MTHETKVKAARTLAQRTAKRNHDARVRLVEYRELSANPTDTNYARRCELLIEGIQEVVYPSYLQNWQYGSVEVDNARG